MQTVADFKFVVNGLKSSLKGIFIHFTDTASNNRKI